MNYLLNKTKYKIGIKQILFIIVLVFFSLSQILFLTSDADLSIASGSRGAWSDEGLNTCQIRNFIHHNQFNLLDCDNFLKSPLFSFFLFPFFKLFGISLLKARAITLMFSFSLLLVFLIRKSTVFIGISFILTTALLLPIHQYSHLCVPEIYCSLLIIASILTISNSQEKNKTTTSSIALLIFAILFKIQFIYILVIPISTSYIIYYREKSIDNKKQLFKAFLLVSLFLLSAFLLWKLPFKNEWSHILKILPDFSIDQINIDQIKLNIKNNFISKRYIIHTIIFIISISSMIYNLRNKKYNKETIILIIASLTWVILESHKLVYTYLPLRYLISLYISMGFFTSIIIGHQLNQTKLSDNKLSVSILIFVFIFNVLYLKKSFNERQYTVQIANNYFKKLTNDNDVIIGSWAPGITWETKCYSYPIWEKFLGKRDPLKYYNPNYIITEINQEDSDSAYFKNNIALNVNTKTIIRLKIAQWNLKIYQTKIK